MQHALCEASEPYKAKPDATVRFADLKDFVCLVRSCCRTRNQQLPGRLVQEVARGSIITVSQR